MEQRLEKQAEEMSRAAREITEAVGEFARAVDRFAELQRTGGIPEEEAVRLAQEGVREVRKELEGELAPSGLEEERRPAPTPEAIREWERRREERRRREGYKPV